MKSLFLLLALVSILSLGLVHKSAAQTVKPFDDVCQKLSAADQKTSPVCAKKDNPTNPLWGANGLLTKAARLITMAVGVAAVVMIFVGGIKYVTSAGDSSGVNSAKNTILYAVVGLLVASLGQAIIIFVLQKL